MLLKKNLVILKEDKTMDIGELIQQFCVPVIAMVCYCICYAIKRAELIKDKYIPMISLVLGGISGVIMNGLSYEALAGGIASGALAVAIHQVYKQSKKDAES